MSGAVENKVKVKKLHFDMPGVLIHCIQYKNMVWEFATAVPKTAEISDQSRLQPIVSTAADYIIFVCYFVISLIV